MRSGIRTMTTTRSARRSNDPRRHDQPWALGLTQPTGPARHDLQTRWTLVSHHGCFPTLVAFIVESRPAHFFADTLGFELLMPLRRPA
jgi:hypothetical protein